MQVKAKFKCVAVTRHEGNCEIVKLSAATGPGNEEWSKFTPSGDVTMTITNPEAAKQFEPGKLYSLTFEADA